MKQNKLETLDQCRKKISQIDHEIFRLIKEREQVSAKIGEEKRKLKLPDKDFLREKKVFANTIKIANELNIDLDFATTLQQMLIELSLSRQERDRIIQNKIDQPKSVLVIGGSGRMGQWLCNFFSNCGHDVSIVDPTPPKFSYRHQKELDPKIIANSDLIVIATPIRESIKTIEELKNADLEGRVVFDISSIKSPVKSALKSLCHRGAEVTSIHPMFGPSVNCLFGRHIIRSSLGSKIADDLCKELFRHTSVEVVDMSFDEHDKIISFLLALSHMVNIGFVRGLSKSNLSIDLLQRFASPTFVAQIKIAKQVFSENPHLYFEIQNLNEKNATSVKTFLDAINEIQKSLEDNNEEEFVSIMKSGRAYLDESESKSKTF